VTLRERTRRSTVPPMPAPLGMMPPGMAIPSPIPVPTMGSYPLAATPPYGHAVPVAYSPGAMATPAAPGAIRAVVDVERDLLVAALTRYRGRIPAVARALGWSRGTIYNKMRKYQLEPDQFRDLP
jgi:transcriptional regulator with GAF, ATPase, and Fis domain